MSFDRPFTPPLGKRPGNSASRLYYNYSLNSAAGGKFLDKRPRDCLRIIESKSKVRQSRSKAIVSKVSTSTSASSISPDVAKLKDMVKALLLDKQKSQAPATIKAVEESCVTCGGAHCYRNYPATDGNNYRDNIQEYISQAAAVNYNQGNTGYRPPNANQVRPPGVPPVQNNHVGDTKTFSYNTIKSVNRIDVIDVACEEFAQEVLGFSNISESGNPTPTLEPILSTSPPSFTPFRGGEFMLEEIEGHLADNLFLPGIDDANCDPEGDLLLLENDEPPELELKDLPPHLEYAFLEGTDKLPVIIAKGLKDEDKTALLKVLRSHKHAIAWKISDIKGIYPQFCTHKIFMEEDAKPTVQHQRWVNPKIHETDSLRGGEFMLEEIEGHLADNSFLPGIDDANCDPEGDLLLLENDEPPELELKDLPPHLEYAFLEGTDKLPVIIAKGLKDEDKTALLKVLRSHKHAIAWKIYDIRGIDPHFCTHKILMEEDAKPTVQHQRRVNPKIHKVIKKEVIKLLDAGLIYPIFDSPWVGNGMASLHRLLKTQRCNSKGPFPATLYGPNARKTSRE
ncbi:hypothetical protein Tco_0922486 [Tanacetum coccineum]|uniref:Reverse transcriptase domain-containing protein n=1 Tax=Tanacetum coccineum TaxID=301880 RepID=A0ABQ5CZQ0_9ASTR